MTSSRHPESALLSRRIKEEAARLGFALAGIVPAAPALSHGFYEQWLAQGFGGEMAYLHRHAEGKRDPRGLEPSARSLIVLGYPYPAAPAYSISPNPAAPYSASPHPAAPLRGRISRYALGADYHDVLGEKLRRLAGFIEEATGKPLTARPCVDSAPLMEREYAARAGLGWVGRNAMLIHWKLGSWLFLAELLVDLKLAWDTPPRPGSGQASRPRHSQSQDAVPSPLPALNLRESCGTCRACIEACPTGAIVRDKTVDSRRCISYLTIELKGPIPRDLRPAIGDWVFGCDICQEVCPWNRKAPQARQSPAGSAMDALEPAPSLPALLAMDEGAFRSKYRHTSLWRAKRRGVLRNAAIALGNIAVLSVVGKGREPVRRETLAALSGALRDAEPLVRGAAAWALGRMAIPPLNLPEARETLTAALESERDPTVREEIAAALR